MEIKTEYQDVTELVENVEAIHAQKIGTVFVQDVPDHKELLRQAGIAQGRTPSNIYVLAEKDRCEFSHLKVAISSISGEVHYTLTMGEVVNSDDASFAITGVEYK